MTSARLSLTLPDGTKTTMPAAQALALAELSRAHDDSTWHFARCGCCVCFHPGGDSSRGWLIGADGESEYHEGGE